MLLGIGHPSACVPRRSFSTTCAPVGPGACACVVVLGLGPVLGRHMESLSTSRPTASLGLVLGRPMAGPGLILSCPTAGPFRRLFLPPALHLLHRHWVVEAPGAVGPHIQVGLLGRDWDLVAQGDLPVASVLCVEAQSPGKGQKNQSPRVLGLCFFQSIKSDNCSGSPVCNFSAPGFWILI